MFMKGADGASTTTLAPVSADTKSPGETGIMVVMAVVTVEMPMVVSEAGEVVAGLITSRMSTRLAMVAIKVIIVAVVETIRGTMEPTILITMVEVGVAMATIRIKVATMVMNMWGAIATMEVRCTMVSMALPQEVLMVKAKGHKVSDLPMNVVVINMGQVHQEGANKSVGATEILQAPNLVIKDRSVGMV